MTDIFQPPRVAVEREGAAGVRLPLLRYQLLIGLTVIGGAVRVLELGLCVLLCMAALRGPWLEEARSLQLRPAGLELTTWLSWAASTSLVVTAVTAGLLLAWLVRARRNARALGMPARTPGVLLWWFVPVAQLFAPYMAVRGILQASRGGYGRTPAWLATWWLVWLATSLWICVEVGFARSEGAIHFLLGDEVGVVLMLGLAGQAVLAHPLLIAVVVAIQRAQQQHAGHAGRFAAVTPARPDA